MVLGGTVLGPTVAPIHSSVAAESFLQLKNRMNGFQASDIPQILNAKIEQIDYSQSKG